MILKLKRDAGWTFLDQIEEFRTYGYIERVEGQTREELADEVDRVWGDHREFEREIWPTFEEERPGSFVEAGVADLNGGRAVLVLWNDEAFLLSEEGHTIDRLR